MQISYVLRKSFGLTNGSHSKHIAKGTVLIAGTDDALISTLFKRGASLEEVIKPNKVDGDDSTNDPKAKVAKK